MSVGISIIAFTEF